MTMHVSSLALAFAALVTAAAPFGAALADTATDQVAAVASNPQVAPRAPAGTYDGLDQYRTAQGFPQPGWQYLFLPPN
jgi:hypothetical protein